MIPARHIHQKPKQFCNIQYLKLKDIVLIGRTYDEYCKMFRLKEDILRKEVILDAASGVSSFCAEASAKGFDVTASDMIYEASPIEIRKKCILDLDTVIRQLPGIAGMYIWKYFRDIKALKEHREKAYLLFIEDFEKYGQKRYIPVHFPYTHFPDNKFTITLVSHFLFLYEDQLNYDFHKKTILELLRITSKQVRIFPVVNLKGKRSSFVDRMEKDNDLDNFKMSILTTDYEFMRKGNEMFIIKK